MTRANKTLTELTEWQALIKHHEEIKSQTMRDWFDKDPGRFAQFSCLTTDLLLDYSRNRITSKTISLLCALAKRLHLSEHISALFKGEVVNISENRAALHTALRDEQSNSIIINGENIAEKIATVLNKMEHFSTQIHNQSFRGLGNKPIKSIVNIGIGGSYLGPKMTIHALKAFACHELQFHFVSGVDGSELHRIFQTIDPEETLFIISSKSFTTLETLTNAKAMADWVRAKLGENGLKHHFIAVTAAKEKALAFGITEEHIFPMWDWVGGRYSIWSAIGLPLMLMLGPKQFRQFLSGAFAMDRHFCETEFRQNIPVLMALIEIWYINFFHVRAKAIVPYGHALQYLTSYLQQAEMESNGKSVNVEGHLLTYATCAVIFGGEGCHGQHAYHQLLHQGTDLIPVDFILTAKADRTFAENHHSILLASGLSQAQALMRGKLYDEAYHELLAKGHKKIAAKTLAPHLMIPGNRPSNIILLKALTPKTLGMLLALYEHKIFVQASIWNINPFDQWGVELGKQLLPNILQQSKEMDAATTALMKQINFF